MGSFPGAIEALPDPNVGPHQASCKSSANCFASSALSFAEPAAFLEEWSEERANKESIWPGP